MLHRPFVCCSYPNRCSASRHQIKAIGQQAYQAARHTAFKAPSLCSARRKASHVARVAKDLLAEIEALKSQADALDSELQQASRTAEVAAKRSRRLANRSQELQAYAIEHILLGDETAARAALLQKASVADALAQATRRAEANSSLARKLEDVLTIKQAQLLVLIKKARQQTDVEAAAATAAAAAATVISSDGSSPADVEKGSKRSLKRSPSVAWSSPSLHAGSDGWEEQLLDQQDALLQRDMGLGTSGEPLSLQEPGCTVSQEVTLKTLLTTRPSAD